MVEGLLYQLDEPNLPCREVGAVYVLQFDPQTVLNVRQRIIKVTPIYHVYQFTSKFLNSGANDAG